MKLLEPYIKEITKRFDYVQTNREFIELLDFINSKVWGKSAHPIKLKSFTYYSNPRLAGQRYNTFEVPKKNGDPRTIHAPHAGLKSLQKPISLLLQCLFEEHWAATGFVFGKSIVDNAKVHTEKNYVFNMDMKDFFPSIDKPRFWKRLQYPPFDLNEERGRLELANRISAICFENMSVGRFVNGDWQQVHREVLPQGAATSPVITNIIAQRLDKKLSNLADHYGLTYTRYADDITFSSMHNVYQKNSTFLTHLENIIGEERFQINPSKTRVQKRGYRQEVTGLIVNKKVNVTRRYLKQLRHWIYLWETYGYEKATELITNDYMRDKGHVQKNPSIKRVIAGKLEYLKMVKGSKNSTYMRLKHRFDILCEKAVNFDNNRLLELWETNGIDAAMRYFIQCIPASKRKSLSMDGVPVNEDQGSPTIIKVQDILKNM